MLLFLPYCLDRVQRLEELVEFNSYYYNIIFYILTVHSPFLLRINNSLLIAILCGICAIDLHPFLLLLFAIKTSSSRERSLFNLIPVLTRIYLFIIPGIYVAIWIGYISIKPYYRYTIIMYGQCTLSKAADDNEIK